MNNRSNENKNKELLSTLPKSTSHRLQRFADYIDTLEKPILLTIYKTRDGWNLIKLPGYQTHLVLTIEVAYLLKYGIPFIATWWPYKSVKSITKDYTVQVYLSALKALKDYLPKELLAEKCKQFLKDVI